jgi:hypothetical protein
VVEEMGHTGVVSKEETIEDKLIEKSILSLPASGISMATSLLEWKKNNSIQISIKICLFYLYSIFKVWINGEFVNNSFALIPFTQHVIKWLG